MQGKLPKECLRIWTTGSQACEQTFRLLRSMTGTFSTMVNFTLKGILERINKLNYISSIECTEEIIFPRVKRRLLQVNEESDETLSLPTLEDVEKSVASAKLNSVNEAERCSIILPEYSDHYLTGDNVNFIDKIDDGSDDEEETIIVESVKITQEEFVTLQEDYSQIRVAKKSHKGIATYAQTGSRGTVRNKTYKQSQFVLYQCAYIRKSTALYLLQENSALSSDRLIRVRTDESKSSRINSELTVKSGDFYFFKRVDSDKILAGSVIQFSYLEGNKRQREYSGTFVDTSKESYKLIDVFANWFVLMDDTDDPSILAFTPLDDIFTAGYLSMENYMLTIPDANLIDVEGASFAISANMIAEILPNWNELITVQSEFR